MKYLVLSVRSKQYLVQEGDKIYVQGTGVAEPEVKTLFSSCDGKLLLGKPDIKLQGLKLAISDQAIKGDKVKVSKYKAKSRYRRSSGIRPVYTQVTIEKLP